MPDPNDWNASTIAEFAPTEVGLEVRSKAHRSFWCSIADAGVSANTSPR